MPNTVPNDYNPYAGCHKYEELIEELKLHEENAVELLFKNQKLKEQNETLQVIATEGARKRLQLKQENNKLKEQLDTLDQECASRMNKEQESKQDEIITKLCDMIRGLVPDPHADALIDEAYGENE